LLPAGTRSPPLSPLFPYTTLFRSHAVGIDPLGLVVLRQPQQALADADGGRGDAHREHRRPRHAVERLGAARTILSGSLGDVFPGHRAVVGNHRALDHEVLATGARRPTPSRESSMIS